MPVKYEDFINEIESKLSAAFDRKDPSGNDLAELRLKYVMIDGKPLITIIKEYQNATNNFDIKNMSRDEMIKESSAIILKALVNNQHVFWAKPEERTNAFNMNKIEPLTAPEGLEEALENEELKSDIDKKLEKTIYVSGNITDEDELEAKSYATAKLLEDESSTDIAPFLMEDLLRDVINDPENGEIQSVYSFLSKLTDKTVKFTFARQAFISHAVAMLLNEGHTPEEIFDPSEEGIELRAQAGKRLYKLAKDKNVDELLRINIEGSQSISRVIEKRIKRIDYSDESSLLSTDNKILAKLAFLNFDLQQERDRYRDKSLDTLAALEGEKITTAEQKAAYEEKYIKLNDDAIAYSELNTLLQNKKVGIDYLLGLTSEEMYASIYLPQLFKGLMTRSLIAEAVKNGEAIKDKLYYKALTSYADSERALESSADQRGIEIYNNIKNNQSHEDRIKFVESIENGKFAGGLTIGFNYKEDGSVEPVMFSNPDKLSSKFSHHPKDRAFYSKRCTMPTDAAADVQEADKAPVNSALKSAFESMFNVVIPEGIGGLHVDGLYLLTDENRLIDYGSFDFDNPQDMSTLREYLLQGRVFVANEHETAPVQLGVSKDSRNNWVCSAADCLDNNPQPVEYKWYHKLGAFFNIKFCLDRKAALDDYNARLVVKDAVIEKKMEREAAASFESVLESIENNELNEHQKKLDEVLALSEKNAAALEKYPQDAAEVIRNGNEAIEALRMAELDNEYIEPERRLQLMKDVIKSSLVQVFSAQAEKAAENDGNLSTESLVAKALVDPKTGDEAFKQIFDVMYPDKEKFLYMQPKYLVNAVKNAKEDVTKYQKNLKDQLEKLNKKDDPAAENVLSKNDPAAENVLSKNDPKVDNLHVNN